MTPGTARRSDGPEFPEPVFPNRTPRRILWGVVALGVIMLVLAVAVTALSNSGSKSDSASNSDADVAADDTTPDTKADPELKPPDSSLPTTSIASTGGGVFTESNHLYQITAGPDWHLATSGLSATPLWTIGAATNADASIVNIVAGTVPQGTTTQQFAEQTLAGIKGVAGLTLTSPAPIPTTLTDGTPAAIITNDYVVSGVKRSQELLVAVNGTTAVTITVSSPPNRLNPRSEMPIHTSGASSSSDGGPARESTWATEVSCETLGHAGGLRWTGEWPHGRTGEGRAGEFMAATDTKKGTQNGPAIIAVAIVVGLGLVLTVGALVFRSDDKAESSSVTAAAPTTATTAAATASSTTTTAATGPIGVPYVDPNKIFHMTLGADWTPGPPGFSNSPTWLAPVGPAGTAQVNPLVSRAAGADSLDQYVQSTITRLNGGALYRTTTTEPTTLTDGTPATIVHYVSANDEQLVGRAIVTVNSQWGLTMLVQCPPTGADACFASLDPYIKSVSLS